MVKTSLMWMANLVSVDYLVTSVTGINIMLSNGLDLMHVCELIPWWLKRLVFGCISEGESWHHGASNGFTFLLHWCIYFTNCAFRGFIIVKESCFWWHQPQEQLLNTFLSSGFDVFALFIHHQLTVAPWRQMVTHMRINICLGVEGTKPLHEQMLISYKWG